MKDRSQIVMLVGLVVLILVVLNSSLSFNFFHLPSVLGSGGALKWILIGLAIWLFMGNKGGCCSRRSKSEES
ncbi:MAG: hypothetical protein AB8G77_00445 [Rhodothermales bacterium]